MITDGSFKCKDGRWIMMLGVESRLHWTKTITALELQDSLVRLPNPQSCARELACALTCCCCFQPLDWSVASKSLDWQRATVIADERFATKTYDEW